MSITRVDNLFSQEEIDHINKVVSNSPTTIHNELGRIQGGGAGQWLLPETHTKLTDIARKVSGLPLKMDHAMTAEYSNLYGEPNLRTHLDGDMNDLIINIQLEANTVWDMGLNQKTYTLDDNSALVFNANKEIHWRVHKEFKDGEYVRMMFVRFYNPENISDYSYLPHHPDDEMFKEVREFRDGLGVF
jgi:hypothetical protein